MDEQFLPGAGALSPPAPAVVLSTISPVCRTQYFRHTKAEWILLGDPDCLSGAAENRENQTAASYFALLEEEMYWNKKRRS